jgi:hypothetical protein
MTEENTFSLMKITPLSGRTAFQLTPFSKRGITHSLQQVTGLDRSQALGDTIREDVNGNMMNLTSTQFQKYEVQIQCTDQDSPSLDGGWLGQIVEFESAIELSYPTGGSPQRNVVSGSSRTANGFTYYRPVLIMMVIEVKNDFAEYEAKYVWALRLREAYAPS